MNLNDVNRGIHKHKKRKRVGRGPGSGHGKTSGRGHKGQGRVAGWSAPPIFEGGQMPLVRRDSQARLPQRVGPRPSPSVNVGDLDEAFEAGEEVTPETLARQEPGQGPLRRAQGARRRRADQEAEDLGPPVQPVGAGEDRAGRRRGDRAARQERRSSRTKKEPSRPRPKSCDSATASRQLERVGQRSALLDAWRHGSATACSSSQSERTDRAMWEKIRVVFTIPELRQKILLDAAACWPSTASAGRSRCRSSIRRKMTAFFGERPAGVGRTARSRWPCSAPASSTRPRSSAWASCPTSRPRLSSSCWAASGRPLEKLQKEGESGRKKINEYTRYATVVLCIGQSWFYVGFLVQSDLVLAIRSWSTAR